MLAINSNASAAYLGCIESGTILALWIYIFYNILGTLITIVHRTCLPPTSQIRHCNEFITAIPRVDHLPVKRFVNIF